MPISHFLYYSSGICPLRQARLDELSDVPLDCVHLAGVPFGLGQILLLLTIMNYIADYALQYTASSFAANSRARSVLGATFTM